MKVAIARYSNDLRREIWRFSLMNDYSRTAIYFDDYAIEEKPSKRHRNWHCLGVWHRISTREMTLQEAPLPPDVETEMRLAFQAHFKTMPIIR